MRSTARIASLQRCIEALEQYPDTPNGATWLAELKGLQGQYNPAVDANSSLDSQKRGTTRSLKEIRKAWREAYLYTKRIMEGLLIRGKRHGEYKSLFLDLQKGKPVKEEDEEETEAAAAGDAAGAAEAAEAEGAAAG